MRITERMRWTRTQNQLESSSVKRDAAAERALTGKRVNVASDDVQAYDAAKRLEDHSNRHHAYVKNAEHVELELDRMDGALGQAHSAVSRAREISVQFGDASYNDDEMRAASVEVDALRETLSQIANTDHMGRSLFAGSDSRAVVVDDTGGYQGASASRSITIGKGVKVDLQTAEDVFGAQGASAFDAIDTFQAALESGDSKAIRDAQAGLDETLERFETAIQRVGADLQRTEEAKTFADNMSFMNSTQSQALTEADFAEAISSMQQHSTLYELSMRIASDQKQLTRSLLSL